MPTLRFVSDGLFRSETGERRFEDHVLRSALIGRVKAYDLSQHRVVERCVYILDFGLSINPNNPLDLK